MRRGVTPVPAPLSHLCHTPGRTHSRCVNLLIYLIFLLRKYINIYMSYYFKYRYIYNKFIFIFEKTKFLKIYRGIYFSGVTGVTGVTRGCVNFFHFLKISKLQSYKFLRRFLPVTRGCVINGDTLCPMKTLNCRNMA